MAAVTPQPAITAMPHGPQAQLVRDLLRLQRAVQQINSVLDLDEVLDRIADEVVALFGCLEASVWLCDHEAGELVMGGQHGCSKYEKGARLKIGKQGMIGWVAAHVATRYAPDVSQDPYYIPCEDNARSEVVLPLKAGDELIGVFTAAHTDLNGFSPWHLQMLEQLAQNLATAVVNARRFRAEQAARELMLREAAEAREIQEALSPKSSPFVPGFAIEGRCLPAGAVGGDWYDFVPLSEGRWGIVLADVAGKGMSAALLMAGTRAALRAIADTCVGPAGTLQRLNRQLLDDMPSGRFVTMVYAVFDPAARAVSFANAGHPWPLFANGDGVHALKTERGLPLGIVNGAYSEVTVELQPGSRLLFYSDGLSEATNHADEMFGSDGLGRQLLAPEVTADHLLAGARRFGGEALADDATVILVRAE